MGRYGARIRQVQGECYVQYRIIDDRLWLDSRPRLDYVMSISVTLSTGLCSWTLMEAIAP
jgi:hypothetical protein